MRVRDGGYIMTIPELNLIAIGADPTTTYDTLQKKFLSLYAEFEASDALDDFPHAKRRSSSASRSTSKPLATHGAIYQIAPSPASLRYFFIKYIVILATVAVVAVFGARMVISQIRVEVVAPLRATIAETVHGMGHDAAVRALDRLALQSKQITPERFEQLRVDIQTIVHRFTPLVEEFNPLYNAVTHPPVPEASASSHAQSPAEAKPPSP